MRERIISICTTVILAFSICGCAQTAEDILAAEQETVGTEYTKIEDTEATDAEPKSEEMAISREEYDQSEEEANPMPDVEEQEEPEPEKESCIDTEQVISDFLSMDSIEFPEKYDRDDLYYSGILYCGREAWRYDGGQENYNIENITAIRFYKNSPFRYILI